jgi:hypothetical protein
MRSDYSNSITTIIPSSNVGSLDTSYGYNAWGAPTNRVHDPYLSEPYLGLGGQGTEVSAWTLEAQVPEAAVAKPDDMYMFADGYQAGDDGRFFRPSSLWYEVIDRG